MDAAAEVGAGPPRAPDRRIGAVCADQRRRDATARAQRRAGAAEAAPRVSRERGGRRGARGQSDLATRLSAAETEREAASAAAHAAQSSLAQAEQAAAAARAHVDEIAAARSNSHDRMAGTESELAAARARVAALDAAMATTDEGLARAARARGGTLLAEGLEVEPDLRRAVSAVLGSASRAYLLDDAAIRGPCRPARHRRAAGHPNQSAANSAITAAIDAATAAGGGLLSDAILRDPQAEVSRLLARVVWLPTLAAALAVRAQLPPGWRAVTVAGEVVDDQGIVELGASASALDLQAERSVAEREASDLEARLSAERSASESERAAAASAADESQKAGRALESARLDQRRADEQERVAQRRAEQLLRELNWERSQAERLKTDVAAADALITQLMGDIDRLRAEAEGLAKSDGAADRSVRRLQLVGRRDEMRRRREDRLATVRVAEEARRRAEIGRSIDEARARDLDGDIERVAAALVRTGLRPGAP